MHRSKWQAASGKWQVAIQPAVWQTGNLAIWQPGDMLCQSEWPKIKADKLCNCSRRQVNLPPHSPFHSRSSCSAHCVADFGSKWHGHICRFTGPVSRPPSPSPSRQAAVPPRHVCIIFIARMPWQRLCCMCHNPVRGGSHTNGRAYTYWQQLWLELQQQLQAEQQLTMAND